MEMTNTVMCLQYKNPSLLKFHCHEVILGHRVPLMQHAMHGVKNNQLYRLLCQLIPVLFHTE